MSNGSLSPTTSFCSGYDRYTRRRTIYELEDDFADSDTILGSQTFCHNDIPSRFHFDFNLTERDPSFKKNWFQWDKNWFLKKSKREDPLKILKKVATTKLKKRYTPTSLELGKGISGLVFLVTRNDDHKNLAAKLYKKNQYGRCTKSKFLNHLSKEVIMLAQLHHDNVISTIDIVSYKNHITTIMEYVPINLFRLVKDKLLSLDMVMTYFSQLGAGVAYLHNECHIAHRDLKLENLGVGQDGQLKILDFGSAVCLNPQSDSASMPEHICPKCPIDTQLRRRSSIATQSTLHCPSIKVRGLCGSDPYIAPEIWESEMILKYTRLGDNNCLCGYDPFKADIWSLGVLFVGMISGKFLWSVAKPNNRDFVAFKNNRTYRLSKFPLYLELALGMLTVDPNQRFNIDQVMNLHHQPKPV